MRQFLAQLKNWRKDVNAKMLRLKGGLKSAGFFVIWLDAVHGWAQGARCGDDRCVTG